MCRSALVAAACELRSCPDVSNWEYWDQLSAIGQIVSAQLLEDPRCMYVFYMYLSVCA